MSHSGTGLDKTEISISGGFYDLDMDGSQTIGTTRSVSMQKVCLHISGVAHTPRSVTHSLFLSKPPPLGFQPCGISQGSDDPVGLGSPALKVALALKGAKWHLVGSF